MSRADPDGLAMAPRNLPDHALSRSTREGGWPILSISGAADEKSIILAISDNGTGFEMQFRDRILEIFQPPGRAEDYPGDGVGPAIVRKAMRRMGGRVWAESAPAEGTVFYPELPR